MPRVYKPPPEGLASCISRDPQELEEAAALLGGTLVLGCELSFELRSLEVNPMHPARATDDAGMRQAFVLLQGMLVAERWIIEFLTGPPVRKRDNDICVDCFVHDWRFPAGELANALVNRLSPINKLAAHPTWEHVIASPRQWTLTRVGNCVDGLSIFAEGVRTPLPTVATLLDEHIDVARQALLGN